MGGILSEKTAVITGGSSGIGRGIAMAYAREGANVIVADLQELPKEGGPPTHELIEAEYGVNGTFVECDVTEVGDLERAVSAADEFGGIDVMVNNAAIFFTEDFEEATESEFDRMMAVNAKGPYFGAQQAINRMLDDDGGCIINISSVDGIVGSQKAPLYCMTKAAVKLLTYSLADRFGSEGIRVNAIHPGSIETTLEIDIDAENPERKESMYDQIALGREGRPSEIGDVASFLASDLSSYITGQSITVDGGWITHL